MSRNGDAIDANDGHESGRHARRILLLSLTFASTLVRLPSSSEAACALKKLTASFCSVETGIAKAA